MHDFTERRSAEHGTAWAAGLLAAVAVILQLLAGSQIAFAADAPAPIPEKLRLLTDFFKEEVASGKLPGAVVLIQQHGRPVYLETFGVRDIKTGQPMTVDTQFALAEPLPDDTLLVEWENARRLYPEWESGGSGLVSTPIDYARFAQMLLNGGELDGKRYLSWTAFEEMTTDHVGP